MNKLYLAAAGAAAFVVISATAAVCTWAENRRMSRYIRKCLANVEDKSEGQISDEIIRKAVERAAGNKVDEYMKDTEDAILRVGRQELKNVAQCAVEANSKDIREKAASEIARQVEMLDIEELKERVCEKAEKTVVKKFDGALDGEVKKFREQLDSTRKLYSRMAKAATEDEDSRIRLVML